MFNWLKGLFNSALAKFNMFLKEAFPIARQIAIGALKDIAQEAVKELNYTTLTNEEKRKAAFKKIKEFARKEGIEAKDSVINSTIELAVLTMKKELE